MSRALDRCYNIMDLRGLARRRLPSPVFEFIDGGAESEATLRRNLEAFDGMCLVPRALVDVSAVKTETRIFGQPVEWPVFCSPTGGSRIFHEEGERAVARAAAASGIFYGLSTNSTWSLEDIAAC